MTEAPFDPLEFEPPTSLVTDHFRLEPLGPQHKEASLERHAADFAARKGFTFTVLDPNGGEVIGCVYLYPSKDPRYDAHIQSWVSADRAQLDKPLADAVAAWVAEAWPWERVLYR